MLFSEKVISKIMIVFVICAMVLGGAYVIFTNSNTLEYKKYINSKHRGFIEDVLKGGDEIHHYKKINLPEVQMNKQVRKKVVSKEGSIKTEFYLGNKAGKDTQISREKYKNIIENSKPNQAMIQQYRNSPEQQTSRLATLLYVWSNQSDAIESNHKRYCIHINSTIDATAILITIDAKNTKRLVEQASRIIEDQSKRYIKYCGKENYNSATFPQAILNISKFHGLIKTSSYEYYLEEGIDVIDENIRRLSEQILKTEKKMAETKNERLESFHHRLKKMKERIEGIRSKIKNETEK